MEIASLDEIIGMNHKKIIIGNGMIAKSLTEADFGRPTLVLAAGVSDSQETRIEAFVREMALIDSAIANYPELHVLYFSTCSVESGIETPYIKHKLAMEEQVLKNSASSHIFRLPQVVGLVHNRTLVSYFVESILQDRVLRVQTRSMRNLLDVHDFARVAALIVRSNMGVGVPQNIAASTQVSVLDILMEIGNLLGRSAQIDPVDVGYSQSINTEFLHALLPKSDPLFDPGHWRHVLKKYVPVIAAGFKIHKIQD
jgi:nucleoside-diphosphate-sugar epimerase